MYNNENVFVNSSLLAEIFNGIHMILWLFLQKSEEFSG